MGTLSSVPARLSFPATFFSESNGAAKTATASLPKNPLHKTLNPSSFPTTDRGKRLHLFLAAKSNHSSVEPRQKGNDRTLRAKRAAKAPVLSEGTDEDARHGSVCPGCGVFMQDRDPDLPGYFQRSKLSPSGESLDFDDEMEGDDDYDNLSQEEEEEEQEEEEEDDVYDNEEYLDEDDDEDEDGGEFDLDWKDLERKFLGEDDDYKELDGFAPAGVGFGSITEELVREKERKEMEKRIPKSERKRLAREAQKEVEKVTVCARCHSLRNYGQVKNQSAENLIPDFDFDRLITTRLMKSTDGNASCTVVVMVVDCADFDGSFPKRAAQSLFEALEGSQSGGHGKKKLPKLVLVATKVDLLPSQISPARLDKWVRHRARAGGAPKLSGVYLVSSRKDLGVRNLLQFVKTLSGPRGNVWVIGAQNAGKSTLINVMAKKEGAKVTKLTEAPIPGTTLGILRIGGILSAKAKMYDTPGLLHPYLMTMRLNREEQKMVEIRKELQPRTYRVKVGQAIHVGGLARLDLDKASVKTIYVTVWISPSVSLHLGKVENADEIWEKHVGIRLQPPISQERALEMGKWEGKEVKVTGKSWDMNSLDIAIAGLGWFSLGLKGEATVTLWTHNGVEVTLREPLVLDRAPFLERPGFWLPKAVSEALGNQSKRESQRKNELEDEMADSLSEVCV
ncbi:hypothetical protein MLD38_028809 [Melastoma candidum]|uniref:Uncharacterized protein n=1 Tax=Melastoma candidum TaxID=119954 RepID=A0ACB9N3X1_9MYRT|nr:hypothetical protein MLD38_028809 [Melastoma candidum]